jgi:hypothetical protein
MATFTATTAIPTENVPEWEYRTLLAVKQNLDSLLGLDGSTTNQVILQKSFGQLGTILPTITAIEPVQVSDLASVNVTAVDGSTKTVVRWDTGGWQSIPTELAKCGSAGDLEKIKQDIANLRTAIEQITVQLGRG